MRFAVFLGSVVGILLSPYVATAQERTGSRAGWKWAVFSNDSNPIGPWINKECKPKDTSGLFGTIMTDENKDYLIHIWCRADQSSTWSIEKLDRKASEFENTVTDKLRLGDAVLLGIVHGVNSDTTLVARIN